MESRGNAPAIVIKSKDATIIGNSFRQLNSHPIWLQKTSWSARVVANGTYTETSDNKFEGFGHIITGNTFTSKSLIEDETPPQIVNNLISNNLTPDE